MILITALWYLVESANDMTQLLRTAWIADGWQSYLGSKEGWDLNMHA